MTNFWSYWITIISLGSIFGCLWLLYSTRKHQTSDHDDNKTLGHEFDGIEEYDNPLPKWWFQLFVITCIFALVYLFLYPGLGNYKGFLNWTSTGHWEQEIQDAKLQYDPIFAKYATQPIEQLAKDHEAMEIGQRLFANNCALCHGSTARGQIGFPNLTDKDWLYGGSPDRIKESIMQGRNGQMPAKGLKPDLNAEEIQDLTQYLLVFSGRSVDAVSAQRGSQLFQTACSACHGMDAKGNQMLGAPDLTDNYWLYGSTPAKITQTITYGRAGVMPTQKDQLGEDKVHLLAAYVYSLSQP